MDNNHLLFRLSLLTTIIFLASGLSQTLLAKECNKSIAQALSIQGRVELLSIDGTNWKPVQLNETFCPGDRIRVGTDSRASLKLYDETLLRLAEHSSIRIGAPEADGSTWLDLLKGVGHFISRVRHRFQVNTPYVNAGIEGTEFTVETTSGRAAITVLEGQVKAHNAWGEVLLKGGQRAVALAGEAPYIEQVVGPLDAVKWTLFYPPISDNALDTNSATGQQSIAAFRDGDLEGAFSALALTSETEQSASLLTYRASLYLRVGNVEAAQLDLKKALRLEPGRSDTLALLSIIATAQNQRQQAFELAQKALKSDPQDLSALLALSYAQQSQFQLTLARDTAQQATHAAPDSSLAWSQLARLYLMFNELDEANAAALRAVEIAPDNPQTLAILGFVRLSRLDFDGARETFEKAIAVNGSAAPLPRFGLGLVDIRQGRIAEGRRQLEIAVNLDPGNAMFRSYLGKAYYEERREKRAATQFALAKQLDELDPTAWFYNALLQESENRPVEALDELQTAIDLNDNRAVYRSRFQLEQDEAARISALGRIYGRMGFGYLAEFEAFKSLQTNPSNYFAHRLLADSSRNTSRDICDSELLQSQLLQPLNRHPLQSQVLNDLRISIDSTGAMGSGFSEYAQLFNSSNGLDFKLDVYAGTDHVAAQDLIVSGLHNRIAFSLAQKHFEGGGWRENSDFDEDIQQAFLQIALTPSSSLQFEYTQGDGKRGDLALRFEPDDFFDSDQYAWETEVRRIGFHHQLASDGHLILSLIDGDQQESGLTTRRYPTYYEDYPAQSVRSDSFITDIESHTYEFQLIQPFQDHTFILGAGRYDILEEESHSRQDTVNLLIQPPPFTIAPETSSNYWHSNPEFKNAYLYGLFALPARINLTLGVSQVDSEGLSSMTRDKKTNHKFGLTWEAWKNYFFRAAYIENLESPITGRQTIEPTQVAGFNQLSNISGYKNKTIGLAFDAKISRKLRLGAKITQLDKQDLSYYGYNQKSYGYNQKSFDANIFWAGTQRLATYLSYSKVESVEDISDSHQRVRVQAISFGFTYNIPSGVTFEIPVNYYDSKIDEVSTDEYKRSDFWNVDTLVSYHLPKRYGKVSLVINNLLNEDYNWYNTKLGVYPNERSVNALFTINF